MVGLVTKIRFLLFITAYIFCATSCKEECKNVQSIDEITYNYIDFFNTLKFKKKVLKSDLFITKIDADSTNLSYNAYRIYMSKNLLELNEIPNQIDNYKGYKIAFFTKRLKEDKEINGMKQKLFADNFYNKKSFDVNNNYPEWVVVINKRTKCQIIYKDAHYEPLNEILEKIK